MSDNFENIKAIIDNVLGEPKRDYCGSGGWYEYNCPCCGEDIGGPDGKYNFAVQIDEEGLWGHCWKCGYHGKLSRIVKRYGTSSDVEEYKNEIDILKESRFFTLSGGSVDSIDDLFKDQDLSLPNGFKLIDKNDPACYKAYSYLMNRGVGDNIIQKYNIGYVGAYQGKYSNRIVIPSYDTYGDLNYWIARDYTGTNKWKILNPDVDKKKIVFNEGQINWYETITLVEGPFDHIVVPNSIPLLGKTIDNDTLAFKQIMEKTHGNINILLDDDAIDGAKKMYKFLNSNLPGRVRLIECPDGYDASDYYKEFGKKGIIQLMRSSHKLDDFELSMIR